MQRLVDENIYKQAMIYDYQSVCFALKESTNVAGILQTVSLTSLPHSHDEEIRKKNYVNQNRVI